MFVNANLKKKSQNIMPKENDSPSITQQLCAKFRFSDIEFVVVNTYDYTAGNRHVIKCFVIPYIKKESGEQRLDEVFGVDNWENDFSMPNQDHLVKYKLKYRVPGTEEWREKNEGASLDMRERGQFSQTAFESALAFAEKRCLAKLGVGRYLKLCPQIEVDVSQNWQEGWERYRFRSRVKTDGNGKGKSISIYWKPPILPEPFLHADDKHLLDMVETDEGAKAPPEQTAPSQQQTAEVATEGQWKVINAYWNAFDEEDKEKWAEYIYKENVDNETGNITYTRKRIAKDYANKIISSLEKGYGPIENGKPTEYQPNPPQSPPKKK